MKKISNKDREYLEENKHRITNKQSMIDIVAERRIKAYGTTSENSLLPGKVSTLEEVSQTGNHMAEYGNYPVGMSGCYVVGINGGCGLDCPVFQSGDCRELGDIPMDELIKFGYIEE